MWYCNHPTTLIKQGVPKKYLIGTVKNYKQFYDFSGNFYMNIKEKVEKKFKNHRNHSTLLIKASIILVAYWISLYYYIFVNNMFVTLIFGFVAA